MKDLTLRQLDVLAADIEEAAGSLRVLRTRAAEIISPDLRASADKLDKITKGLRSIAAELDALYALD
jgi:hypothetical protein